MLVICGTCKQTYDSESISSECCPHCGSSRSTAENVSTPSTLDTSDWKADSPEVVEKASPPTAVGRYQIRGLLGEGGFGKVYLAYDPDLDRSVAIKMSHNVVSDHNEVAQRLLNEARRAANLHHGNIVGIHDFGRADNGQVFFVMECIEGESLRRLMSYGRIPRRQVYIWLQQIADGVHFAHKKGLVHCDLKPENILIDNAGVARVADFGLAVHEVEQRSRTAAIAGTPAYMSPEQARGEIARIDGRADVWGLGAIMYEMLTGRRPFSGSREEILADVVYREPKPLRQIDDTIPRRVEEICLKCLTKSLDQRYSTAFDFANDLRAFVASQAVAEVARPAPVWRLRSWLGTAMVCIAALALLLSAWPTLFSHSVPVVAEQAPAARASFALYRWEPLLRDPPRLFYWPEPAPVNSRYDFDPEREILWVESPDFRLLELGRTESSNFTLQVGFSKTVWVGTFGVYWGVQEAKGHDGVVVKRLHTLYLQCDESKYAPGTVLIRYNKLELVPHASGVSDTNSVLIASARFPRPASKSEHILEVEVQAGKPCKIKWNGLPIEELCSQIERKQVEGFPSAGEFGILNRSGGVVISNARIRIQ